MKPDVREDLTAYLDGELPAERAAEVKAAIDSSPELQAEVESLQAVWGALDHLPSLEARPGWLATVEAELLSQAATPAAPKSGTLLAFPQRRMWLRALTAAAGILVGATLTWTLVWGTNHEGTHAIRPDQPAPPVQPREDTTPRRIDLDGPEPFEVTPDRPETPFDPLAEPLPVPQEDDPLEGLSDEELEIASNLELLLDLDRLETLEDADLLDALDLLDELGIEEFDEG